MSDAILVLNAGSSTIKFGLFEIAPDGPRLLCKGLLDEHDATPQLTIKASDGEVLFDKQQPDRGDETGLLDDILRWVDGYLACDELIAIGHRVVHGGPHFVAPVLIDEDVLSALHALTPLAPLHQPRSCNRSSRCWRCDRSCRRSPVSTPRFTTTSARWCAASQFPANTTRWESAATASTACPISSSPIASPRFRRS